MVGITQMPGQSTKNQAAQKTASTHIKRCRGDLIHQHPLALKKTPRLRQSQMVRDEMPVRNTIPVQKHQVITR